MLEVLAALREKRGRRRNDEESCSVASQVANSFDQTAWAFERIHNAIREGIGDVKVGGEKDHGWPGLDAVGEQAEFLALLLRKGVTEDEKIDLSGAKHEVCFGGGHRDKHVEAGGTQHLSTDAEEVWISSVQQHGRSLGHGTPQLPWLAFGI